MRLKKLLKFGKKFEDILNIKKNFYKDNDVLLKKQKTIAQLYKRQSVRKKCKACESKLRGQKFINHNIEYIQCKICTHVNGRFNDTESFSKTIYESSNINYSKTYKSDNSKKFLARQKKIYNPKADFLKKYLKKKNKKIKILDFGCGSGYFVSSLFDRGLRSVEGVELSKKQIDYGKNIFKKIGKNQNLLRYSDRKNIYKFLENTDANCITLIGVLEHLVDIHMFLKCIKRNKNIKIIYLCVPMFSVSCLIENSFPSIFNRHLGGGHTHLFTSESLKKLMKKFGFQEKAAWWFGTDMPDLYRSFCVNIEKNNSKALQNILNKFKLLINDLQLLVDKRKLSSQVHMIFKR